MFGRLPTLSRRTPRGRSGPAGPRAGRRRECDQDAVGVGGRLGAIKAEGLPASGIVVALALSGPRQAGTEVPVVWTPSRRSSNVVMKLSLWPPMGLGKRALRVVANGGMVCPTKVTRLPGLAVTALAPSAKVSPRKVE